MSRRKVRRKVRHIVESHHARNPRVFGSVIRGADTRDSDLDILIDPTPDTSLFGIGAPRHELPQLPGVPVDVLTQASPVPPAFSVPQPAPLQGANVPPAAHPQPAPAAAMPVPVAPQPTPRRVSCTVKPAAVGVTARLVVGEEGRVQQIFWDQSRP